MALANVSREISLIDFDQRLRVGTSGLIGTLADLMAEERVYVENSVASRQVDFATGRMVARRLLRELGYSNRAIGRDTDRVPLWPDGVLGSISHTEGACLVAVSVDSTLRGVGVDVEVDEPRSDRFVERITTPEERTGFGSATEVGRLATQIFSIKEAVYKACFPVVRERWGFRDVEVEIDLATSRFLARTPIAAGDVEGQVSVRDARVWTVAFWA
jgi:4'-phosphopantetheinyl transferase EntD